MATYLVVAAHPDDADFGVAGTAARLAQEGHAVHYLVLTSGEQGSEDPDVDTDTLIQVREAEQDAAARILGVAGTHYLRQPDGLLEPTLVLRKQIVRHIRALRPDVVIAMDPRTLIDDESTYLNHPDHRAAGQVALDAVFPGPGNPAAYRDLLAEGLQPHKVREVWLFFVSQGRANHWFDITDTLERKIEALSAHDSQIGEWARNGGLREEMVRWAEMQAQQHGLAYRYAEGFQRVILVADEPERPPEADALEAQISDEAQASATGAR
jgi:LmbE family N-acetylglucosaminyl deacetylase